MQKYINNVAVKNGARVLTPLVGGIVTVTGIDGSPAEIFDANGGLPRTSVLLTDINGAFSFYAADGRYTITITGAGIVPITISDVLLEDPVDGAFVIVDGAIVTAKLANGAVTDTKVATGSKLRRRLDDVLNVKDPEYGAVGNGVANDTAAIQAAINQGGKVILLPEGTYLFTKLNLGIHQTLKALGSVRLITTLASGNAITCNSYFGNANQPYRQKLIDGPIMLENTNATNSATAIYFGDTPPLTVAAAPNLFIDGLTIKGFLGAHALGNNAYIIQFANCNLIAPSVHAPNSRCLIVPGVLENSGGMLHYDNVVFQGWENVFSINLMGIEIGLAKCSFDVCKHITENLPNDSVFRADGLCRYEYEGNSTQWQLRGNAVGCTLLIDNPYVMFNQDTPTANPAFISVGDAAHCELRGGVYRTGASGVAAYCTVLSGGTLTYSPTYKILGVAPTVFANKTGTGILKTFTDSGQFSQILATVGQFKMPVDGGQRLSIRWGDISVASPGVTASGVTAVDVTWAGPLNVVSAMAQVYPSASNDFFGVIASVPLTQTTHRFVVKNGALAQGVTGQYLIVGYE